MRILLILLFSLSLFAFEGKKLYECSSKYRIINGSPHEFSPQEEAKTKFSLVFSKNLNRVKTSDGMIYSSVKSKSKGATYKNIVKVNGRTLNYKLKIASKNGLYKSVSVTGYGNLINEYVLCKKIKKKKKKDNNDTNSSS
ncbi:MAG: hypothetical protein COA44_08935 [Arcobacter sp.]|nr:MAG: hypothetical protein COA44_08935 [Arcobacter sp.]